LLLAKWNAIADDSEITSPLAVSRYGVEIAFLFGAPSRMVYSILAPV